VDERLQDQGTPEYRGRDLDSFNIDTTHGLLEIGLFGLPLLGEKERQALLHARLKAKRAKWFRRKKSPAIQYVDEDPDEVFDSHAGSCLKRRDEQHSTGKKVELPSEDCVDLSRERAQRREATQSSEATLQKKELAKKRKSLNRAMESLKLSKQAERKRVKSKG
jgi:hypothetical protein